jgi:hypothetical protein
LAIFLNVLTAANFFGPHTHETVFLLVQKRRSHVAIKSESCAGTFLIASKKTKKPEINLIVANGSLRLSSTPKKQDQSLKDPTPAGIPQVT